MSVTYFTGDSVKKELKPCAQCDYMVAATRHHRLSLHEDSFCEHPRFVSLVTGRPALQRCSELRSFMGLCGPEGEHYMHGRPKEATGCEMG